MGSCDHCLGGITAEFIGAIGTKSIKNIQMYCTDCTSGAYRCYFDRHIISTWKHGYAAWLSQYLKTMR